MYAYSDCIRSFYHQESIFLISTEVSVYGSSCVNYKAGLFWREGMGWEKGWRKERSGVGSTREQGSGE